MTAKFSKLDKFEGVDFRRWQKKMHFLLTTLKVVMLSLLKHSGMLRSKVYGRRCFKQEVPGSSSVNMVEDRRATKTNDRKGKRKDDDVAWWIDSGATTHACKDRGWFKVFQPVDDGFVLHMGNESSAPIVGVGSVVLEFTFGKTINLSNVLYVPRLRKNLVSGSVLNKCGFRQVFESDNKMVYLRGKNRVLKEMVNSMLSYSGLSDGFWGEAMLTACYLLNRVPKKGTRSRDEVSTLYPYCFNVEDDPKIFDEAMKSQDVAFWKEAINDEMDFIMGNNTWVLADLPPGCKPLGCKWIFKKKMKVDGTIEKFKIRLVIQGFRQRPGIDYFDTYALLLQQVDLTKEFLSSRFSMKDMGEADVILGIRIIRENKGISISQSHYIEKVLKKFNCFDCTPVSTPMDPSVKLMPNTGKVVFQLEYSKDFPSIEGYSDASWITNVEDHSSTSGWVFLLGGGAISWASKKQTCITNSTMESEFVALAAAGKEAEWLRNLIHEIPLWPKPISPISIHCDSAATLAKAYSQCTMGSLDT
ncbi:UNVERIFIED_CONTAM: Retrovirus-related Pol polyprotein from transposon TNT 1-94 [Sesamum latifolium]|uniref:Retrovirus-related Pol polyprotein from transposon TNT 1-94 n=1 Tax=Sesamum latifolium TaxID=2727402 RepID=A0AAW2XIY8_9LAMI